jgi:hypothetical protein
MKRLVLVVAVALTFSCSPQPEDSVVPTTTTTSLPPLTADNLEMALPVLINGAVLGPKSTAFDIRGSGECGGRNGDKRALDTGATDILERAGFVTGIDGEVQITVYAFSATEQAELFMDATAAAVKACADPVTFKGEPQTFFGGDEALYVPTVDQVASLAALNVIGADQAFAVVLDETRTVRTLGETFGYDYLRVNGLVRSGEVVIALDSEARGGSFGFADSDTAAYQTLPTPAVVEEAMNGLVPEVVRRLNERLVPVVVTTTTAGG